MESIVNYESDDGNSKTANKSSSKVIDLSRNKEKRHYSSEDDSSDSSDSPPPERSRKSINEDDKKSSNRLSSSPRKSSHKSSRSEKHKSHESRSDRHRKRSSSRDSDKYERRKRKDRDDDRDDKKRHRKRSKDRGKRSESRDKEESSRDRHRDRTNRDRHTDRKRYNRQDDDRRNDERKDYRRDDPSHRNNNRNANHDGRSSSSSSSSSAIRRAEALNRTIERRANEKVQQLQKLGIEIPALMQTQLRQLQEQQSSQIKPLMSISTGIASGLTTFMPSTTPAIDETKAENENLALNMSNFTSSVLTNPRYTEQMQKKKLIWGAKKATVPEATTNNKWEAAKFSQDQDGKVASKFLRLMGMKNATATTTAATTSPESDESSVQKREQMFSTMEQQYEIARQATHTMRGMGLGFGSQSRPC